MKFSRGLSMNEPMVTFYGRDGSRCTLSREVVLFTIAQFGLAKAYYSLFVILHLIARRSAKGIYLFSKLTLMRLLGKNPDDLERKDYDQIIAEIIGHEPVAVSMKYGVEIKFSERGGRAAEFLLLVTQIMICNQYTLSKVNVAGKIVIDAGANIGLFSIYAAKLGAKRVYAFEPLEPTFRLLKKNIEENNFAGTIIPINKALGDRPGKATIHYKFAGDGMASIVYPLAGRKKAKVNVITLDAFMKGRGRLDFIKMDTEGSEERILRGAAKTIRRYKPVLSFSAYHNPEDKEKLPKVVLGIRPDYKCVLHKKAEEDIYCE